MTATVHPLPSTEVPVVPPRVGKPWDLTDFEGIVAGVRDGLDLEKIAAAIGRRTNSVPAQLRKLLPHDQRGAHGDVARQLLAEHLEDPDYDWRAELARPAPARPIVVEQRHGFAGFERDDLIPLVHAVLIAGSAVPEEMRSEAVKIATVLNLWHRIEEFRRDHLYQRPGMEMSFDEVTREARQWSEFHNGSRLYGASHPWSEREYAYF